MDVDHTLPILMDEISNEALNVVRDLSKTKDLDEKKKKAEVIHLLCQSMSDLLMSTASAMCDAGDCEDDEFPVE